MTLSLYDLPLYGGENNVLVLSVIMEIADVHRLGCVTREEIKKNERTC